MPLPRAPDEATACVGDFDGDSCDDVLWLTPGASPVLWRARCAGEVSFSVVRTPPGPVGGYPVGCGG